MSANQTRNPSIVLGYPVAIGANSSSLALSAAATWVAFQIVLNQTKTLSAVRLYLVTKTGAPTTAGCTCDLYSDSAGIPNASTEGPISADSVPASGNWMGWTFAGTSVLTAGTPYWLVFKNGTATPASNFPTYQWAASAGGNTSFYAANGDVGLTVAAPMYGWNKVHTVNSGTAWASTLQWSVAGPRLSFTDSTYDGNPIQSCTRPGNAVVGDLAFGKAESGVRFNVPAGVTYNVRGAWFYLNKLSTPGNLVFKLWQGATLLATSNTVPAANITTASQGQGVAAYFSSSQPLSSANNPYRLTMSDSTAADTNTKGFAPQIVTYDSDVNSLALKPMGGTAQKTVTADNTATPVVFTDTPADVIPFALLLDSAGELTASGGSGGYSRRPR